MVNNLSRISGDLGLMYNTLEYKCKYDIREK